MIPSTFGARVTQPFQPQPPPYQPVALPAPPRTQSSRWAVIAAVVGILNLVLTIYLVIVVIRAQVALAELGRAFQGFPGSLSGLGG